MKSAVFFTLLSLLFSSCYQRQATVVTPKHNIISFIDTCIFAVPNANNNNVTRAILADTITARLQRHSGDTLAILSDLVLEYEGSLEYVRIFETFESELDKNAGKYLVKFSSKSFNAPKSNMFDLSLQVLTIMDKDDVTRLLDRGEYTIQGKFVDFANDKFKLPTGRSFMDYPRVSTSVLDKGKMSIYFGTLILEDVVFKNKL